MTTGQEDRRSWTPDQEYAHQLELQKQRDAYFARKKHEAEEAERQQKRDALQRHLSDRGKQWEDHTGTPPSERLYEQWVTEYMDEQELVRQAEREARLAEAESLYPGPY